MRQIEMCNRARWRRMRLAACGLAVLLAAGPAPAEDSSALLQLLEVLRDNGTIPAEAYEALRDAAVAEAATTDAGGAESTPAAEVATADAGGVESTPAEPSAADLPGVEFDLGSGGLEVATADGAFSFQLGGRIHFDSAWYFGNEDVFGDGTELRRMRLRWDGTVWSDWDYKGEVDFAGSDVSLKSTYIRYSGFDFANFVFGNFKENFSLNRLTSSNATTFMERAAASTVFSPGRNIGLGVSSYGKLDSLAGTGWTASLGVFSQGENDGGPDNEGWAVTGRATAAPPLGDRGFVHLGAALSQRGYKDIDMLQLRARPESHVTSTRLVDTGDLENLNYAFQYGVEGAIVYGPFSVQGEYLAAGYSRSGRNLDFDGGYVFGSWILTGESRSYDAKRGIFKSVVPKQNVGAGGYGAWELAVRYSALDLSDADVVGGEQEILTIGLNWYVNPNIRFMANYIDVLRVDRPGSEFDDVEPEIFQLRGQVNF